MVLAPGLVQQVLQAAGHVMARHAGPARLDGIGDLGDGAEIQLADLAADVGLAQREALADDAAFLLLVGVDVDAQPGQVDAPLLGPIEHGRFQGLGPHHRAVDLLLRQAVQEIDDVLVLIFSAWMGVKPPCSIRMHRASEAAMADVQPKVR